MDRLLDTVFILFILYVLASPFIQQHMAETRAIESYHQAQHAQVESAIRKLAEINRRQTEMILMMGEVR